MRTLIAGGGIGGLTVAIALARAGHQVTLAEKMPDFTPAGAGIIMAPNAAAILAKLDVELAKHGQSAGRPRQPQRRTRFRSPSNRTSTHRPVSRTKPTAYPRRSRSPAGCRCATAV